MDKTDEELIADAYNLKIERQHDKSTINSTVDKHLDVKKNITTHSLQFEIHAEHPMIDVIMEAYSLMITTLRTWGPQIELEDQS